MLLAKIGTLGRVFNPAQASNLQWWLDETSVQSVSDIVYQWDDLSGNGYHAIQTSEVAKPTFDTVNKCVVFDGDDLDSSPENIKVLMMVVSNINGKAFNASETGLISDSGGSINLYRENKTANLGSGFVGNMAVNDGSSVSGGDIIITDPVGYTTFPWDSNNRSLLTFEFDAATSSIIKIMQQRPSFLDGIGNIYEIIGLNSDENIPQMKKYLSSKWGVS